MRPKQFFITWLLLSFFLLSSCNYFQVEKVDRFEIKKAEIENIKKQTLENYPEIFNCGAEENPKICFERQLNEHLGERLKGLAVDENEATKDTLWLTVNVSKDGKLSLKPLNNIDEDYTYLYDTIQNALNDISPVKPAFINGVTVNCNFKLPLVIKNVE